MNKIIVEVFVPSIERKFEVFIPVNKKIKTVIMQLSKAINGMTNGDYMVSENTILCSKINGGMYDSETTIKESNLKNGDTVLLI